MLFWNQIWLIFLAVFHLTGALPVGESPKYIAQRGFDEVQVVNFNKRDNQLLNTFFTQLNSSGLGVKIVHTFYANPLTRPTVLTLANGFIKQVDFDTLLSDLSSSGLAHDVAMLMFYNDKAFPGLWSIISTLRLDGTISFKKRELNEKRSIFGDILNGVGNVVSGVVGAITGGGSSTTTSSKATTAATLTPTGTSLGSFTTISATVTSVNTATTGSVLSVGGLSATTGSTIASSVATALTSSTASGTKTSTSPSTTTNNGGIWGIFTGIFGGVTSEVGSVISGVNSAVGSVVTGVTGVVDGIVNTTTTSINSLILSSQQVSTLTSVFDAQSIAAIATLLQLFQANKNMGDWIIALEKSGLGVLIVQDVVTTTDGQTFAVLAAQSIKKNAPQPFSTFVSAIWSSGFLWSMVFQFLNPGDIVTIFRYLLNYF